MSFYKEQNITTASTTPPIPIAMTREQKTRASYRQRHSDFKLSDKLVDEKIIRHDHQVTTHYESQTLTRNAIHHRDLGHLSLIASLTRVQYGYWHNDPACLLGLRFQFIGSTPRWRFEKADIELRFASNPMTVPEDDPVVVDYGPKHLESKGTEERRDKHFTAMLSASTAVSPMLVMPTSPAVSAGMGSAYDKHYAATVEGIDFSDRTHKVPNAVRFWVNEDEKQKEGLPLDFYLAVVVKYGGAFQAMVDVKTGPVFDLLARPWTAIDPILFEPGIEYEEPIRTAQALDFSTLTLEEWRKLVTPDLDFGRQEVHHAQSKFVQLTPPRS